MPHAFERHTISFVLRLWMEPVQEQGGHNWRGQLEHVGSGEKAYFQVPEALLSMLAGYLVQPERMGAKGTAPAQVSPTQDEDNEQ